MFPSLLPTFIALLMGVSHHHGVPMHALHYVSSASFAHTYMSCVFVLDLAWLTPLRDSGQLLIVVSQAS